jgi:hypothetical protein
MDNMDKIVQQILAQMNANADAGRKERKAYQEKMAADQENWLAKMKEESREVNQDLLARIKEEHRQAKRELLARMDAMFDAHQKRIMDCLSQTEATDFRAHPEKMGSNPEKKEAVLEQQKFYNEETAFHSLRTCRSETMECQETKEARLEYEEPASEDIKDDQNETSACNEATEKIEQDPGMMQSAEKHQDIVSEVAAIMPVRGLRKRRRGKKLIACLGKTDANREKINHGMMQSVVEHQNVPSEEVAVMSVGEPRKRRTVGKSTAGRREEPKERIRGNCGSRRKLAAACRKVSRHARVTLGKRKLFRTSGTQENYGPSKDLTAA